MAQRYLAALDYADYNARQILRKHAKVSQLMSNIKRRFNYRVVCVNPYWGMKGSVDHGLGRKILTKLNKSFLALQILPD